MANSYNQLIGLGTHSEDANLESHWKLQETAGTIAADSSSHSRNGTVNGMGSNPVTGTGPNGWLPSAFDLDGSNDYVSLPDLPTAANWTVAAWLRWSGGGTNYACPFAGKFGSVSGNGIAAIQPGKYSVLRGNNAIASTQYTSTSGAWNHIVATYDGANDRLYYNGTQATTGPADTGYGITNTRIGWGYLTNYYAGRVAGVAIFSRVLNSTEINDLRLGPEPINTVAPTISGSATVGSVLTATTGTWNAQSNGSLTYSYQWTRDGADISGATSSTYTTVLADDTKVIRCRVRGSNDGGYDSAQDTVSGNSVTVTSGSGYSLTANAITTGGPTLGTPAITQLHALAATAIATGAPTLGTPTLTQTHSLSASPVTTGGPTLGTPTITQSGTFTAVGIATGAPTLGTPTLTQRHSLSASPVATGAPTLGTPTLSSGGQLTASPIVSGAPTLGTPSLSQVHSLGGVAITTGAPTLGIPALTQRHQLTAIGIVTGAPTLGTPGDAVASVSIPWVVSSIPSIIAW